MTNEARDPDVRELNTREIEDVTGGLSPHVGNGPPAVSVLAPDRPDDLGRSQAGHRLRLIVTVSGSTGGRLSLAASLVLLSCANGRCPRPSNHCPPAMATFFRVMHITSFAPCHV